MQYVSGLSAGATTNEGSYKLRVPAMSLRWGNRHGLELILPYNWNGTSSILFIRDGKGWLAKAAKRSEAFVALHHGSAMLLLCATSFGDRLINWSDARSGS